MDNKTKELVESELLAVIDTYIDAVIACKSKKHFYHKEEQLLKYTEGHKNSTSNIPNDAIASYAQCLREAYGIYQYLLFFLFVDITLRQNICEICKGIAYKM